MNRPAKATTTLARPAANARIRNRARSIIGCRAERSTTMRAIPRTTDATSRPTVAGLVQPHDWPSLSASRSANSAPADSPAPRMSNDWPLPRVSAGSTRAAQTMARMPIGTLIRKIARHVPHLGEDPAQHRSQGEADRHADAVEAEGPSALDRRERARDDRGAHGDDHRRAHALDGAERDKRTQCGRGAAEDAGEREDREADEIDAPEGEHLAQPAEGEQQAADHQQVGDGHPLDGREVDPQVALDRRHGDVDDAAVEGRHERPERDRGEDEPLALHGVTSDRPRRSRRFDRDRAVLAPVLHPRQGV